MKEKQGQCHLFLTAVPGRGVVSLTPLLLYFQGNNLQYPLNIETYTVKNLIME